MKVKKKIDCYIDKGRLKGGFCTGVVLLPPNDTIKEYDSNEYYKGSLTYEEDVPTYIIESFIDGVFQASSLANDIREIKVGADFYEALKAHSKITSEKYSPLTENTVLKIFNITITKEGADQ